MITRRQFLKLAGAAVLMPWGCPRWQTAPSGVLLNDVHSGLNPTTVRDVIPVRSSEDIQRVVERAVRDRTAISVAGGRHAMGGQQFGADTLHLDMRSFNRVRNFDSGSGLVEVESWLLGLQFYAGITHRAMSAPGLEEKCCERLGGDHSGQRSCASP
jgi:hypothetical protein